MFGEHKRSVRVAWGAAESNSWLFVLSKLPKCIHNLVNAQLKHTVKKPNGFIPLFQIIQHIGQNESQRKQIILKRTASKCTNILNHRRCEALSTPSLALLHLFQVGPFSFLPDTWMPSLKACNKEWKAIIGTHLMASTLLWKGVCKRTFSHIVDIWAGVSILQMVKAARQNYPHSLSTCPVPCPWWNPC